MLNNTNMTYEHTSGVATVALPVKTTVHMTPTVLSISERMLPEKKNAMHSILSSDMCAKYCKSFCMYMYQ